MLAIIGLQIKCIKACCIDSVTLLFNHQNYFSIKKRLLLIVSLFLLIVVSCKKDAFDGQKEQIQSTDQSTSGQNWVSSGFNTGDACLENIPSEFVVPDQRAITKQVYDLLHYWSPSIGAYGKPIWEATVSSVDIASNTSINTVPLVDTVTEATITLFVIEFKGNTFTYRFFERSKLEENLELEFSEYEHEGVTGTLTSIEILEVFTGFDYALFCGIGTRDDESNCYNFNCGWWKKFLSGIGNFFGWLWANGVNPNASGDDAWPGNNVVSGGDGTWSGLPYVVPPGGGTEVGNIFTDEDIIHNYYNMICQWYEGYDPESEFNDIPASILPGGSYDELQAKKCCTLSVLQDGGNPMDNPVLADLLSVPGLFDNTIATWVCENGSPLDDSELEMVSVFVVMKTDECGDLAWRDFKQLYQWVVDQPSTSSLNRQEMANVICLIGMYSDTNIPNEDLLELILDNNCETDDPYTDNVKCFNDALVDYVINQFLDNENFSPMAQLAANTLEQIQQNSNGELTLAELIDVLNAFELYFDNPSANEEALVNTMRKNGINPLAANTHGDALIEETAPPAPPSSPTTPMTPAVFWQKTNSIRQNLKNQFPSQHERIDDLFACWVLGPALEEAALNSFGIPKNSKKVYTRTPDGWTNLYLIDGIPPTYFPVTIDQPVLIEIKGRFNSFSFDYSGQPGQLADYLLFLQANAYANNTICHGLYLVLPENVTLGQNIINDATLKNVPIFHSTVELVDNNVDNFRVKPLDVVNISSLDRSGHLFSFLSDGFFNWGISQMVEDKLAYDTTEIDFQKWADRFKNLVLIPNEPASCPED